MIRSALLCLAALALPASAHPSLQDEAVQTPDPAQELETRRAAAGDDVQALWELSQWCKENALETESRAVLERLLELEPEHEEAHKALRHHHYDGKWFESYTALSAYKREEERRMLEEHGLVRFRDDWVPQDDVAYLRMGWVEGPDGRWRHPEDVERLAEGERLQGEGWQQQDLTWIPPDEFDPWREGKFKCGDQWLAREEADAYHAEIGRWWQYPSEHFVTLSTCNRAATEWAGWYADQTYADLVRVYGIQPDERPRLVVVRNVDQYNALATGDPSRGIVPVETEGTSSLHYAYFGESWFDPSTTPPRYRGTGIAYWNVDDESVAAFGQHAVRCAAGLAYAEAIDPSWNTVGRAIEAGAGGQFNSQGFWSEKRIPRWLRYGAANYVERWFHDAGVGPEGDPNWARRWSLQNLESRGGLGSLDEVFAFRLDPSDVPGGGKRILEAGLVVAFLLDGKCAPVATAHGAFKQALRTGQGVPEAVQALQQALSDHRDELDAYLLTLAG